MSELYFQGLWADWLILLVSVAVVVLVWFRYHREPLSGGRRALLMGLRVTSFLAVIVALQNPLIITSEVLSKQKEVLFVLDDSRSMSILDGDSTRSDRMHETAEMIALSELKAKFRFPVALMSNPRRLVEDDLGTGGGDSFNWPAPIHPESHLGHGLREAVRKRDRRKLASIVLFSDGRDTGLETLAGMDSLGIPIHTVRPTSAGTVVDHRVTGIVAPDIARVNDTVEIVVRVYRSDPSVPINVEFQVDDKFVDSRPLPPTDVNEVEVSFEVTMERDGWHKLTCLVPDQDAAVDNNSRSHLIHVIDRPLRVLLAAGGPGYDFRYLKEALLRDETVEPTIHLQSASEKHPGWGDRRLEHLPKSIADWLEYDVVVMIDLDAQRISDATWRSLGRWINESGGGLVVQAGHVNGFPARGAASSLLNMLPVIISDPVPRPAGFSADTGEGGSFVTSYFPDEGPQFYWAMGVRKKRVLAEVLLSAPGVKCDDGSALPLISWIPQGRGKVGFIGLGNLWRLRLRGGDTAHYGLYSALARFLTDNRYSSQDKNINIRIGDEGTVTVGEEAVLDIKIRDRFYNPVDARQLECVITDSNGLRSELVLPAYRTGHFRGVYDPRVSGSHEIEFTFDGVETRWQFMTYESQKEFEVAEPDSRALSLLAESSGGRAVESGESGAREIVTILSSIPDEQLRQRSTPLWAKGWYGLVVLACLISEWFLRRKWNLA